MVLFETMNSASYETAKELFSYLDKNQKGYISVEEIAHLSNESEEFTQTQLYSIFSLLDKTGQGKITLQDFTEAFLASGELSDAHQDRNTEEGQSNAVSAAIDCPKKPSSTREADTRNSDTVDILFDSSRHVNTDGLEINIKPRRDVSSYPGKTSFDITNNDDVFEGDGLLCLDSPVLSASPSRSPIKATVARSPSLRRRQSSRNQLTSNIEKDQEVRLPPDGVEGDSNRRSPKSSTRKDGGKDSHKRKTHGNIDKASRGFATEAISDLLKIVDSHTLSNLGVYGNKRDGVWRHDVNWNVSNDFERNDLSDERTCPPWLRASMDWSENGVVNGNVISESRESGLNESGSEMNSVVSLKLEDNDCESLDSDFYATNNESSHLEEPGDEAELDPMCDISGCQVTHTLNEDSPSDSNTTLNPVNHSRISNHSEDGANKMQVGATVDKNVLGNLIFDLNNGNQTGLYDKILNYSGVELNSRLSSSETSLHELLLEAEAARNSSCHVEDWDSVMKRINGVTLFGG